MRLRNQEYDSQRAKVIPAANTYSPWTAAACCRFRAGSLLPNHRSALAIIQNGCPQQAVERKAAAGCSSPKKRHAESPFEAVTIAGMDSTLPTNCAAVENLLP